jgi:hypothetical protein
MTRKWGSCSMRGTVTLAADLIEQDRHFQDFVVAHELLHLRVPNHGRLFDFWRRSHSCHRASSLQSPMAMFFLPQWRCPRMPARTIQSFRQRTSPLSRMRALLR